MFEEDLILLDLLISFLTDTHFIDLRSVSLGILLSGVRSVWISVHACFERRIIFFLIIRFQNHFNLWNRQFLGLVLARRVCGLRFMGVKSLVYFAQVAEFKFNIVGNLRFAWLWLAANICEIQKQGLVRFLPQYFYKVHCWHVLADDLVVRFAVALGCADITLAKYIFLVDLNYWFVLAWVFAIFSFFTFVKKFFLIAA